MKKLNLILVMLMFLLCALSVSASTFTVNVEPASDESTRIYDDEVAEFKVTIRNYGIIEDKFLVYSLDPSWIINSEEPALVVAPNEEKTFTVYIDPTTAIAKSGIYALKLDVKSTQSDDVISSNEEILIKSNLNRQYQPAVSVRVTVNKDNIVDPRDDVNLKITLINRNALDIPKLAVFVENAYYEDSYEVALAPNSEIIKLLSYELDPYTAPVTDTLKIRVLYEGRELVDKRIEYDIQENKLFFTRNVAEDSKFMFNSYIVNLTNYGNIESTEVFSYAINGFSNLFTETIPNAEFVKKEDSSALEFDVTLKPGESTTINVTSDYRFAFNTTITILLLIIIFVTLYYTFRSPILVTKKATVVAEKDGGTSEIKVLLNIRNRTNKILENISVIDRIPDITEIEDEFSLGTLKPTKIVRNSKKGTLIKWDFPTVEGYEERLITYKIHSKLGILGNFVLPSTIVRFETPNGRKRAIKSKAVEKA